MDPRSESTAASDPTAGADATPHPRAPGEDAAPTSIVVVVARSGGFAGIRREWRAEPPAAQAPRWETLIDACPWEAASDTAADAPGGADRFLWDVHAQCGDDMRGAHLRDDDVDGPWERLIAAVRDFASPDRSEPRAPAPDRTPPRAH